MVHFEREQKVDQFCAIQGSERGSATSFPPCFFERKFLRILVSLFLSESLLCSYFCSSIHSLLIPNLITIHQDNRSNKTLKTVQTVDRAVTILLSVSPLLDLVLSFSPVSLTRISPYSCFFEYRSFPLFKFIALYYLENR